MRLVTHRRGEDNRAGFLLHQAVIDAETAAEVAGLHRELLCAIRSVKGLLARIGPELNDLVAAAAECEAAGRVVEDPQLAAPVPNPEKILCVGLNYRRHADEFGDAAPDAPNVFAKFANSLIGPHDTIGIPSVTAEVDFEGELAVVIGRRCRHVTADNALAYVAGCMVFNDVTARDLQRRTSQWTAGKAIDTFGPCGPAVVSLDEVGELKNLRLRTTLNGALMQDASISEMIHSVPETIAFLSRFMTLTPGDVIATGTPHGVGFRRDPPIFMRPGDVVEVEIDRIGTISNRVAAEEIPDPEGQPVGAGRAG